MTDQDQPDPDQLERAFEYYPRLRKVKVYVENHLDEPMTLEKVSNVVNLEKKYFSAWFKEKTGWRFSEWVQRSRIERAKELLEESNRSITELAFKIGYSDPRGFQLAFKKWTGMTPTEYKQRSIIG